VLVKLLTQCELIGTEVSQVALALWLDTQEGKATTDRVGCDSPPLGKVSHREKRFRGHCD
jgi:hypothetical protein